MVISKNLKKQTNKNARNIKKTIPKHNRKIALKL